MALRIPTARMVRARLERLTPPQLKQLAQDSEVPFGTLMKIRIGETKNPGIETVRKFFDLVEASAEEKAGV